MPRNTKDVLELAMQTTAQSCTAHAAGLWPFYERKELIRTFIVVTDEEENWGYENVRFQKLYEVRRRKGDKHAWQYFRPTDPILSVF